ncbi:hypothetical protein [Saccharothrix sp. Mg75]|uniref:hypothetical protein n=1 Tax=Saccharothrix sp. Mg75 TaxID=3445357 RepID=UPI003EE8816D
MTSTHARSSLRAERTLLVVVRNFTSLDRLLTVVRGFDPGVPLAIKFTIDLGSGFARELKDHLKVLRCHLLPWQQARARAFDLVLAAHSTPRLGELTGPVFVIPHGAGHARIVPFATGDEVSPAGIARSQLTHRGRVVATVVGLAHEEEFDRLARSCAEAVPRAAVIGDPVMDQLVASTRARPHHRRRLGVGPRQKLVLVSSTWGGRSTLATTPGLLLDLLSLLPADEYRVAFVRHWNVEGHDSRFEVDHQLRAAREAGLVVVPPDSSWGATLLAADVVIGDHGSVTLYGAALGLPVLLVSDGGADVAPDSPNARLWEAVDRLGPAPGVRAQVESALEHHVPERFGELTARVLGRPGGAWQALHDVAADLMRLPRVRARVHPVPDADPLPTPRTTAHRVTTRLVDVAAGGARIEVERFPDLAPRHAPEGDPFPVVDVDREADPTRLANAEVLVGTEPRAEHEVADWAEGVFHDHPGALIAAATDGGHCTVAFRGGAVWRVNCADPLVAASALHCWTAAGFTPDPLVRLWVRVGADVVQVKVRAAHLRPRAIQRRTSSLRGLPAAR